MKYAQFTKKKQFFGYKRLQKQHHLMLKTHKGFVKT